MNRSPKTTPYLSTLVLASRLAVVLLPVPAAFAQPPAQSQTQQQKDLIRADAALSAVQKRVALVVGNKDYADAPLKNPVNDAESMAAALKGLGFDVICKTNLTNREMAEAVDAFAQKLDKNTIGLFYFSGHGIQVAGVNYLVPIGYNIKRQADVPFEAFPAQRLLDTMGGSGCTLNLVILDACRNNPLPKSLKGANDKGLGKMDAPSGTLVAYATAPGQTASDDPDKNNGLYTGVLLDKMKTPGLKIEEVFKLTRVSVKAASKGAQTPWEESSLENDFYFAAGIPAPAPVPAPVPAAAVVVVAGNGSVVDTKGRLTVSANAAGAVVTVDNQAAPGGVFAVNLLDVAEKKVTVKVTAAGYEGQLLDVTLLRGKTVLQAVVLEAIAAPVPAPVPVPAPLPAPVPPPVRPSGGGTATRSINPKDGAELIRIPAGPFLMGDDKHTATLPSYSIYKNLVTVGMYETFCKATKRKMPDAPPFNAKWLKKDHPIVNVSWNDAKAYCAWAGVSLPSEAQWEKAARGTEGRQYPWGDVFDTSKLWCSKSSFGDAGGTARVGSLVSGASPFGVLDMAGNVWQWCEDWYDPSDKDKVLRGGSWDYIFADFFRCASRSRFSPTFGLINFGFRCVSSGLR